MKLADYERVTKLDFQMIDINLRTHTQTYTHVHPRTHTHTRARTHTHTHTNTQTQTHTHTHTHTHTNIARDKKLRAILVQRLIFRSLIVVLILNDKIRLRAILEHPKK